MDIGRSMQESSINEDYLKPSDHEHSEDNHSNNLDQQLINEYMKNNQDQHELMIFDNDLYMTDSNEINHEPTADSNNNNNNIPTKVKDTSLDKHNKIQLVEYDHTKKGVRLGRPRNHGLSHLKSNSNDATKNESDSKYVKYRLNDKPVDGPGSRGGKVDHKVKKGTITGDKLKKLKELKKQSQLVFGKTGLALNKEPPITKPMVKSTPMDQETKQEFKRESNITRTTILNNNNKISRQFPGPLIPIYYDLYDENLINKHQIDESLAFGFKSQKIYYGEDLIFLVQYLSKFEDVIGLGKFGPQDIEQGIGLIDENNEPINNQQVPAASSRMNALFSRLVTLVLNRKPEVNPKFQGKAISELKSIYQDLGMPKEWRDPNDSFEKFKLDEDILNPVDDLNPEILIDEWYRPRLLHHYENPFTDKMGFEKIGFDGISDPNDRLIILKSLANWSLTNSNEIKNFINDLIQKQDIPGDKETYYGARSVLEGFKGAEDLTIETNNKISKKNYKEDNEMLLRYIEPSSNPLSHGLKFRLDEMIIGDLGFKIGRFYLVRMADGKSGGLNSTKKMINAFNKESNCLNSSRFKLYVQDTYNMLVNQLNDEGIEFDEHGNEVTKPINEQINSYIYEIASNCNELEKFINHLQRKLSKTSITSIIYKPLKHLHEFLSNSLPLLKYQELHHNNRNKEGKEYLKQTGKDSNKSFTNGRKHNHEPSKTKDSSPDDNRERQKKHIDYNDVNQSKKYKFEDDDEMIIDEENVDDDDDEFEEIEEVQDDEDDDDYYD